MQILCRRRSLWRTGTATSTLPPRVLLIMIVERLIKIHRYPIYLHYSLLQMCVELKSFLVSETKIHQFFISIRAFFREGEDTTAI